MTKNIMPFPALGGAARRVGDVTVYRRAGAVVVRQRANGPRRAPMSLAQQRQCLLMANAVNLWRSFARGQRPAFEGRPAGTSDYNCFVAHALQAEPVFLPRWQTANGGCVVNGAAVSGGTLPPVAVSAPGGLPPATDIALGALEPTPATPAGRLARAVVDNNGDVRPGDRLLFVLCRQWWDEAMETPYVRSCAVALDLDPADTAPLGQRVGDSPGFAARGGFLAAAPLPQGGAAWVHARPSADGWRYSPQRLWVRNGLLESCATPQALAAAVATLPHARRCRAAGRRDG